MDQRWQNESMIQRSGESDYHKQTVSSDDDITNDDQPASICDTRKRVASEMDDMMVNRLK